MRARLASLLLLVALVTGCDSAGLVLDSQFYVGSWRLVSVSDDSGDRSDEVFAAVDDLDARFAANSSFSLDVDFNVVVNAAGQDDIALDGTYQATDDALILVFDGGIAATFLVDAESQGRVDLTVPGALISQIFGTQIPVSFDGDVVLGIRRQ